MNRKIHRIMWQRDKPENYLHKSIESHHMQTLCQIILLSYFIHFLGTISTAYFSLLLSITKQSPYFLPYSSLIAIGVAPWSLIGFYHYIPTDQFVHLQEGDHSHIQRQKLSHQLKYHMIQLGGEKSGYHSFSDIWRAWIIGILMNN